MLQFQFQSLKKARKQMLENSCWFWAGYQRTDGYGGLWNAVTRCYQVAHKAVYEALVGPVPEGLHLDHLCRNRLCINPEHLEPVTRKENILRGYGAAAQNARKTHCDKGHLLVAYSNQRGCPECRLEYARSYRVANLAKKREQQRVWAANRRNLTKQGV